MHPILFHVGSFPVRSFSVMVLIGVLAAGWWLGRTLGRIGVTEERAVDQLLGYGLVFGLLGARLVYLAVHPEAYENVISLVALWKGGLVSYGGFFGGALGCWIWARKNGVPLVRLGDVCLPALSLGQVFGRVGCLLVGDDHGRPWDGPWAITFPAKEGGLIPPELVGVPLHPSQIYLSLMNLVIFSAMSWLLARRRFDGQVMCWTMLLYAVGRFGVEMTRGDDEARGIWGAFSTSQWISIATFAFAAWLLVRLRRRATADGADPAAA